MRNIIYAYLPELLVDKTTGSRILYATDTYAEHGFEYEAGMAMIPCDAGHLLLNSLMVPGYQRSRQEKTKRIKSKAEVMTPSSVCKTMNDMLEKEGDTPKDWKAYVEATVLEITCGEAPFLVSRYDTATGEEIPLRDRIGLLDRKLRAVDANTVTEEEWVEWALKAYQATYGYEYQGDNLLFARVNLFETFIDYYEHRFQKIPGRKLLLQVADIISWNLWQMDGLKDTIPLYDGPRYAKIKDWKTGEVLEFRSIKSQ